MYKILENLSSQEFIQTTSAQNKNVGCHVNLFQWLAKILSALELNLGRMKYGGVWNQAIQLPRLSLKSAV